MKKNLFKILSLALTLVLVLGVMAVPVSAESESPLLVVGGVKMYDGDYLASGATEVSAEAPAEGGYAYYKDGVLALNDYVYEGEGYAYYDDGEYFYTSTIFSEAFLTIELIGDSSITNTTTDGDGITPDKGLNIYGEGTISVTADYGIYAGVFDTENAEIVFDGGLVYIDATFEAVYICGYDGNGIITVNGGSVVCNSHYSLCVESRPMDGDAKVVINGGEVIANSDIYANSYAAASEITVNGGHVSVMGEDHAMHAEKISINGGIVCAEATADGGIAIDGELALSDDVVIVGGSVDGAYLETHFTFYKGDVNGDGEIDAFDYLLLKGIYFETVNYSFEEFIRADADFDGEITPFDYLIVKNVYFEGGEPVLLPEASTPTPTPTPDLDTDTAYAKLYNYILENGTVDADDETYYTISSEPATNDETGNIFMTMLGTYSDSTEYIELGGVITSPDGTEMLLVALQLTQDTTEYGVVSIYVVNEELAAMATGTVIAGGCVDGTIDILDFDGSISETTDVTLETLEAATEELLYESLASIEAMLIGSDISLADFGFDCFAQPL